MLSNPLLKSRELLFSVNVLHETIIRINIFSNRFVIAPSDPEASSATHGIALVQNKSGLAFLVYRD